MSMIAMMRLLRLWVFIKRETEQHSYNNSYTEFFNMLWKEV